MRIRKAMFMFFQQVCQALIDSRADLFLGQTLVQIDLGQCPNTSFHVSLFGGGCSPLFSPDSYSCQIPENQEHLDTGSSRLSIHARSFFCYPLDDSQRPDPIQ